MTNLPPHLKLNQLSRQPVINTLVPLVVTLMHFIKVGIFLLPSISDPAFLIHPGTKVETKVDSASCSSSENSWFV